MSHYEHPAPEPRRHACRTPGEFRRWVHRVRPGSIWTCGCGRRWEWRKHSYLATVESWEPYVSPGDEALVAVLGPVVPLRGQKLRERA